MVDSCKPQKMRCHFSPLAPTVKRAVAYSAMWTLGIAPIIYIYIYIIFLRSDSSNTLLKRIPLNYCQTSPQHRHLLSVWNFTHFPPPAILNAVKLYRGFFLFSFLGILFFHPSLEAIQHRGNSLLMFQRSNVIMTLDPRIAAGAAARRVWRLSSAGGARRYTAAAVTDSSGRTITLIILIALLDVPLSVSYDEGIQSSPRRSEAGIGKRRFFVLFCPPVKLRTAYQQMWLAWPRRQTTQCHCSTMLWPHVLFRFFFLATHHE